MPPSVLMVVHSYCPDDPRVSREAEALAAHGTHVDVICLRKASEVPFETVHGVHYHRVPLQRKRGGLLRYVYEYTAFFLLALFRAIVLGTKRPYEVFQAHNMPDALIFCGLLPRLKGAKLVLDLHDLMPEVYMAKYGLPESSFVIRALKIQEKISCMFADLVITTSGAFRRTVLERSCPEHKLEIVLNSPDERIFPEIEEGPSAEPRSDSLRLIYNAIVTPRSGPDVAIRALALVREEIPEAHLDLLGSGDGYDDCVRLARELGVEGGLTFHGHLPMEEIPKHVLTADLGIISNRRNAFTEKNLPTRIFEYLRMRKPAIVSRTPSIEETFGHDALSYFEAGNPEDLARAILHAHRNPVETQAVLRRGFQVYDRHRWSREKEHYVGLIHSLVDGSFWKHRPNEA